MKPKIAPIQDKEKLRDVRVMQKNLVFVVGLQPKLADESALRKQEYFGESELKKTKILTVLSVLFRPIWKNYEGGGEPMHHLRRGTGSLQSQNTQSHPSANTVLSP